MGADGRPREPCLGGSGWQQFRASYESLMRALALSMCSRFPCVRALHVSQSVRPVTSQGMGLRARMWAGGSRSPHMGHLMSDTQLSPTSHVSLPRRTGFESPIEPWRLVTALSNSCSTCLTHVCVVYGGQPSSHWFPARRVYRPRRVQSWVFRFAERYVCDRVSACPCPRAFTSCSRASPCACVDRATSCECCGMGRESCRACVPSPIP